MKEKIIFYLEQRIQRLEKDRPSIRDGCATLEDLGTQTYNVHMSAKCELKAAIKGIKNLK